MSREDGIGLIHIYTGDGKGKTTAAAGLAVRCAGCGGHVLFFQFLKGNDSGERVVLDKIDGIDVWEGLSSLKFVWNMTDEEKNETRKYYRKKFKELCASSAEYDMLILDEIIPALKYNFVDIDELISFLKSKPAGLEVVMTGREPEEPLVEIADYVTEMRKIKHPYDRGIGMRKMIEV